MFLFLSVEHEKRECVVAGITGLGNALDEAGKERVGEEGLYAAGNNQPDNPCALCGKGPRGCMGLVPCFFDDPQHALARAQMGGSGGGIVTFFIKGGLPEARSFLERVRIFALAESLGGVESLIEHPAIMTHASVPAEKRGALGISDQLIRLSVGLEDLDDLVGDLDQALG